MSCEFSFQWAQLALLRQRGGSGFETAQSKHCTRAPVPKIHAYQRSSAANISWRLLAERGLEFKLGDYWIVRASRH